MTLDRLLLSPKKEVVRAFYKDMWDHADKSSNPENISLKASLSGVRSAQSSSATISLPAMLTGLPAHRQYTTDILVMIEEGNCVSGKMRFHGYHRGELFAVAPNGRHVWWTGTPIFHLRGPKGTGPLRARRHLRSNHENEGSGLKSCLPRCLFWPVASDIAAQANVGVQGNNGSAKESQNPTFLTHSGSRAAYFASQHNSHSTLW